MFERFEGLTIMESLAILEKNPNVGYVMMDEVFLPDDISYGRLIAISDREDIDKLYSMFNQLCSEGKVPSLDISGLGLEPVLRDIDVLRT